MLSKQWTRRVMGDWLRRTSYITLGIMRKVTSVQGRKTGFTCKPDGER